MESSVSRGGWVPSGFVGKLLLGCLHLPCSRALVALHVPWCVSKRACLVPQVQVGGDDVLNEERLNLRLAVAGALARRMW